MAYKTLKTEAIIVRVDSKTKKEVQKLATKSRREPSDYLRLLIEDAIKNQTKL